MHDRQAYILLSTQKPSDSFTLLAGVSQELQVKSWEMEKVSMQGNQARHSAATSHASAYIINEAGGAFMKI